ncbi:hypothetical protein ACFLV7_08715 [Chloroflexota bacterium]
MVEQAYRHVRENHTWGKRVEQFTEVVERLLWRLCDSKTQAATS